MINILGYLPTWLLAYLTIFPTTSFTQTPPSSGNDIIVNRQENLPIKIGVPPNGSPLNRYMLKIFDANQEIKVEIPQRPVVEKNQLIFLPTSDQIKGLALNTYEYKLYESVGRINRLRKVGLFQIRDSFTGDDSTAFVEKDPTVGPHIKAITEGQIKQWSSKITSSWILYENEFDTQHEGVAVLNGTATLQHTNGELIVSKIDYGTAIGFGDAAAFRKNQLLHVKVEVTNAGTKGIWITPSYNDQRRGFRIDSAGTYYFAMSRQGNYPLSGFNVVQIAPNEGTTGFRLAAISVINGESGFNPNLPSVAIGTGTSGNYNSVMIGMNATYKANFRDGIAIGTNATSDQQGGVVIGAEANGKWDGRFGCGNGSDLVALGSHAKGYGWRTTALGAYAHAGGQSSTAIGAGAVALSGHGVALGRGAFLANLPMCGNSLSLDSKRIWFSNGWAHRFPALPNNEQEFSIPDAVPSQLEAEVHGMDAFDASEKPTDFNVKGGHLGLYGGRGTGNAVGGEVRIYTAPINSITGKNDKNPDEIAAKFDASDDTADGTRFLIYDVQAKTLKRVKVAPADKDGRRVLYID